MVLVLNLLGLELLGLEYLYIICSQIVDFKDLDDAIKEAKSVAVVGGGFLGSELACALGHRGSLKRSYCAKYSSFC